MAKRYLSLFLVLLCFPLFSRNPLEPFYYAAPPRLPNVLPEMNTAGFWIARHPSPDAIIMNSEQIARFNIKVNKFGTVTKIFQHSSRMNGSAIKKQINSLLSTLFATGNYDFTGAETPQTLRDSIRSNANADAVPAGIQVRFAFPKRMARQRFAPTFANLNKEVLDIEFDEGQNSAYDIGTPVVLYHDSADGLWAFGATSTSSGWFLISELCLVPQKQWIAYQTATDKVISLKAKADVWLNEAATRHYTFCRMGTAFPYFGETAEYYRVQIPLSDSIGIGYIAKEDSRHGVLPYTARNVYKQAFAMLNTPYGWGDTEGDYDCSSLIKHIFATFGIMLPRNGLQQARVGRILDTFSGRESDSTRESVVRTKGLPAITMLRLEGHIMLYLGEFNGTAYALHDTWGYRKPFAKGDDEVYVVNRTVVSDLYLSNNSRKGSLLSRLTHLSAIR